MLYVLFCFICYGITLNLVYSQTPKTIAQRTGIDLLEEMLECVKCTGFWVGIFVSLFFSIGEISPFDNWPYLNVIWAGFLSSGTGWVFDGIRN